MGASVPVKQYLEKRTGVLLPLAVALFLLAAFAPVLWHDFVDYDDFTIPIYSRDYRLTALFGHLPVHEAPDVAVAYAGYAAAWNVYAMAIISLACYFMSPALFCSLCFAKARPMLHRVLEVDPTCHPAHFGLGLVYLALGKRDIAIREYGQLVASGSFRTPEMMAEIAAYDTAASAAR
jgi:hypothetical protein